MEERTQPSGGLQWIIKDFSQLARSHHYSPLFIASNFKWWITIFSKANHSDPFSVWLKLADFATLPSGWSIDLEFSLILINQDNRHRSIGEDFRCNLTAKCHDCWCYLPLRFAELHCSKNGYLVNDTIIVIAKVFVHKFMVGEVSLPPPPQSPITETERFESFFSNLEVNASEASGSGTKEGSTSNRQAVDSTANEPSPEEVEKAKQSMKELVSDLFKLDMKDRLTAALSTLSRAKTGLSSEQQRSIHTFRAKFGNFVADYLMFEQDNSEFELQKLAKDQMDSAMEENYKAHLSNKKLWAKLTKQEEQVIKKLEEVKSEKAKLLVNWERLMNDSDEVKSRYADQETRVAEAEENKRISEDRMSRSTAAWASLKTLFL